MHTPDTSCDFYTTISQLYGHDGQQWLDSLPKRVAICADQWGLTDLSISPHLSYNYVVMARRTLDNAPVVIKCGYDPATLQQEQVALELYNGFGCVKLLAHDVQQQALLLEQLIPARPLSSWFPHHEQEAVHQFVAIMRQLHSIPVDTHALASLPHIQDWLRLLEHETPALATYHLHKARELSRFLVATQETAVVLHGDLHQGNILSNGTVWRAIDPKGVIGEAAYEVGTFIRNPTQLLVEHDQAQAIISNRIDLCAQLMQINRQRIKDWAYVQAVLAAAWNEHDGLDGDDMMRTAELIDQA